MGPTNGPMGFILQGPKAGPSCKVGLKLGPKSRPDGLNSGWAEQGMGPNKAALMSLPLLEANVQHVYPHKKGSQKILFERHFIDWINKEQDVTDLSTKDCKQI